MTKRRRNLDAEDRAILGSNLTPAFAAEANRRQSEAAEETNRKIAAERKQPERLPKDLGKGLAKLDRKTNYAKDHDNQAVAQAAQQAGSNRNYVAVVNKARGYDNETRTFKKPEVAKTIGRAKGQTKVVDLMKQQRRAVALAAADL